MKIFLGNAPCEKDVFYGVRAGSRWPHFEKNGHRYMPFPFFLAYAASLLEKNGFEVLLVDGIAEKLTNEQFVNKVKDFCPDIVVLEASTVSLYVDLEIARIFRNKLDNIKIVLCGLHYDMYNKDFLRKHDYIDFVLKGEYEYALLGLSESLRDKRSIQNIKGIVYKNDSNEVCETDFEIKVDNLDLFPWPARHFLPKDGYEDLPGILPEPTAQMWASRGCPYGCVFCAWTQIMYGGNKYRYRSPIDVVDEIEHLVKKDNYRSVYFDDDTFGMNRNQVLSICEQMYKRGLIVPWAMMTRIDYMDETLLKAMQKVGLKAIKYGVESGNQGLINNTGKKIDLTKVEAITKLTKKLGIKVHLTFMIGLPGENKKTIKETTKFLLKLDPDSAQISIATPFPGSRYYDMLNKKGYILDYDLANYNGSDNAVIRTEALSREDLNRSFNRMQNKWRNHLRARRIKNKLLAIFSKPFANV